MLDKGTRRWRQKLLKEILETPVEELAERVLECRRFWKRFLLEAFLDRCDDLASDQPQEGLKLARSAPEYARLTKLAEGTLDDDGPEIRAWMVLGSAYRAIGSYIEAEAAYDSASTLRGSADDVACLDFRMAILRTEQGRFADAYELANVAVGHFEARLKSDRRASFRESDHCSLATALVIRGFTWAQARAQGEVIDDMSRPARDFISALKCSTDSTPKARRWALQNLLGMAALSWISDEKLGLNPAETDILMEDLIQKIRNAHGPKSISLARALWIQGSARARLAGSSLVPRARYPFRDAMSIFEYNGKWDDIVHIRLEMAWWCLQCSDTDSALELIAPLLSPDWADRYPRHWRSVLDSLRLTCTLKTAANAFREIRGIKVTVPDSDSEPVTESRGRWDVGW